MLAEILRILKPGGRIIVLTPDFSSCVREFYEDLTHVRPEIPRSLLLPLNMSGSEQVVSECFCHHEHIWNSRLGLLLADLCWLMLPLGWTRILARLTGTKFVSWACERQVLATGVKPG